MMSKSSNRRNKQTFKRKPSESDSDEEKTLENLVLGTDEDLIEKLRQSQTITEKKLKTDSEENENTLQTSIVGSKKRQAAWEDKDDEQKIVTTLKDRSVKGRKEKCSLRKKDYKKHLDSVFTSVHGTPAWAVLPEKDKTPGSYSDEDDELLRQAGNYLETRSEHLPKGLIDVEKVCDINFSTRDEGKTLKNVEFHPSATVAMVAGKSGVASLIQVDGKTNPKIQSVKFASFSINTAHFTANGEELIVGSLSSRDFFYYDMIGGKIGRVPSIKANEKFNMGNFTVSPDGRFLAFHGFFGNIYLLSSKTKEWIGTLKMNNDVRALAFTKDGSKLYSHGAGGEVYVWDMNTRECTNKFYDNGCIDGTSLAVSQNNRYLACGSSSGVVNIYETSSLISNSPKPEKIILNLTTSISNIKFNHTSEFMAMSSDLKDNAIRLVHIPSMTTFTNFPPFNRNIKKPLCLDLSLNSGYLTISNNCGRVLLYRLKHYSNF